MTYSHAHGKHARYLGATSCPSDHTCGCPLPRVCPKGRLNGAYRLTVYVCHAFCSKVQATSTDLFFGAGGAPGRLRYWQQVSAGVVRRAACRSEIPSMFAVRMRVSRSRRELSSTCIEPSDERMGSVAGRTARSLRSPRAAFGESNREPRRRSDDAVSGALTQGRRSPSRKKVDRGWEFVRFFRFRSPATYI